MKTRQLGSNGLRIGLLIALPMAMVALATGPALAAAFPPDDCKSAVRGPGANGPPGFAGALVSDGPADRFADLPVPDFVNGFFGAPSCG